MVAAPDVPSTPGNTPNSTTRLTAVSIVVPVYRSESSLPMLLDRVDAVRDRFDDLELILVDDGSPDHSWNLISKAVESRPWVRGLRMSRNYGQHNALLAGIRAALNPVTVTMDDDLQHRPEDIERLVAALDDDTDLVYGHSDVEEHSAWRNLTSRLAKAAMTSAVGGEMAASTGAFRAFRTDLRDAARHSHDPYVSIDVLLSWATTRVRTVTVTMDQRALGESNYTVRKLIRHAVNMTTGYSSSPLRLVTYLGFSCSVFGVLIFAYVVIRFIVDHGSIPGFPFLASIIALFSGAQMFAIGLLGEYLGRMHFRSMERPPYVIREQVGVPPRRRSDDITPREQ